MKKILTILAIMLLLITACAKTEIVAQKQGVALEGGSATTTKNAVPADDFSTVMQQVQDATVAKNDKVTLLFVPINNKVAKVGDNVIFGAIFNPLNMFKGGYFAKVEFVEARDKSSNKIEVDKTVVSQWIRESVTSDFALGEKENKYLPIVIKVGSEVKSGVSTVPGAYQFEVQIYKRVSTAFDDEIDNAVKSVYVRVE